MAELVAPVVAVAVLLAIVLVGRFHTYHGDVTGFVLFGRRFARYTTPPQGAVILSPSGYDGQFFYRQALDPLLLHGPTLASFRAVGQAFRLDRMAYPALAYVLAAGQREAIPGGLLAINLLVMLGVTAGFSLYARRRGWSPWWALAMGLTTGFLTGTLRDLSDPLAVAAVLGGLIAWQHRARWWTAVLMAIAVLAREPMALGVAAVALDASLRWWRGRQAPGTLRRVWAEAWPAVLVPAAAFVCWHLYVDARYGGIVASSSVAFLPPFKGLAQEVHHALSDPSAGDTAWELAYLGLIAAGIAAAGVELRRRVSGASVAAVLFGILLLVLVFGDPWSYTRLSAPMFVALLVCGLERRGRLAPLVCVCAAAMTVLAPLAPWFGSS